MSNFEKTENHHQRFPRLFYISIILLSSAFPVAATQVWNGLPEAVDSSSLLQTFSRQLKTHYFQLLYPHLIF